MRIIGKSAEKGNFTTKRGYSEYHIRLLGSNERTTSRTSCWLSSTVSSHVIPTLSYNTPWHSSNTHMATSLFTVQRYYLQTFLKLREQKPYNLTDISSWTHNFASYPYNHVKETPVHKRLSPKTALSIFWIGEWVYFNHELSAVIPIGGQVVIHSKSLFKTYGTFWILLSWSTP